MKIVITFFDGEGKQQDRYVCFVIDVPAGAQNWLKMHPKGRVELTTYTE